MANTVLCSEPMQILIATELDGATREYIDLCTHHTDESPCPLHPREEPHR